VAVEKLPYFTKQSKFGGCRMPWNSRTSPKSNPNAISFSPI
jgi:hypothetical protein